MKKRGVTSKDVAKLAGVSQSAVSRCFSPHAKVSEATRQKIHKAARELGYRPNSIARSLITRSSQTVAVVFQSLENPFYSTMLERASRFFQEQGYFLQLFAASPGDSIDDVIDGLIRSQVEGVLMLAITLDAEQAAMLTDLSIPIVIINRTVAYDGVSQVSGDNFHGGYWAAQHLVRCGHQRFAYLAGLDGTSTSDQRRDGFIAGLADKGAELHSQDIGNYRYDDALLAARRLLSSSTPPDAIFAANDLMALAVMEAARHEFHLSVPEELAIIGFDDVPMAAWPSHALTSLAQPVTDMIARATELLMTQIHDPETIPQHIKLPVVPMVRGSTRSLR
ncbi:LacI family DNA-binding transcriptional regulator [Halomonas huangheensis]|nr:LacI family DNA-binding transcriptional regulator [Halomonas huangheensis]ALM54837.1 LacI family transcriptional regulator [Halomonas huangheensis]